MDEVMCDSDEYWAAIAEATGTIESWTTFATRDQVDLGTAMCGYSGAGIEALHLVNEGAASVSDTETRSGSRYAGLADRLSTRGWFEMERLRPTGSTE